MTSLSISSSLHATRLQRKQAKNEGRLAAMVGMKVTECPYKEYWRWDAWVTGWREYQRSVQERKS